MGCDGKKKNNQRIISTDIYFQIAKQSENLTIAQVKECFQLYYKLLNGIVESSYKNSNMQFYLPNIGYFYFTPIKGKKKGSTYRIPNLVEGTVEIVEREKDEPDYEQLRFKINPSLKNRVKFETKKKYEQTRKNRLKS